MNLNIFRAKNFPSLSFGFMSYMKVEILDVAVHLLRRRTVSVERALHVKHQHELEKTFNMTCF